MRLFPPEISLCRVESCKAQYRQRSCSSMADIKSPINQPTYLDRPPPTPSPTAAQLSRRIQPERLGNSANERLLHVTVRTPYALTPPQLMPVWGEYTV